MCSAVQQASDAFMDGALTFLPTEDPNSTRPVHCETLRSALTGDHNDEEDLRYVCMCDLVPLLSSAAFAEVEQEGWLSADLTGHMLAVQALLEVRSAFLREDFAAMHRISSAALAAALAPVEPLSEPTPVDCDPALAAPVEVSVDVRWPKRCWAELSLARDHAAYVLSCSNLCDAIYAHRIDGRLGYDRVIG